MHVMAWQELARLTDLDLYRARCLIRVIGNLDMQHAMLKNGINGITAYG